MTDKLRIGLPSPLWGLALFARLEECFDIRFVRDDGETGPPLQARVLCRPADDRGQDPSPVPDGHCFLLRQPSGPVECPEIRSGEIRFEDSPGVPWPFRARVLRGEWIGPVAPVPVSSSGERVAFVDGACVWSADRSGGLCRYEVGGRLPVLGDGEPLFRSFKDHNFLSLLPIVDWLRNITGLARYRPPYPSACFMIDDPNLHATRYGYVRFGEVAADAGRWGYHMSFATVPLDLFYAHKRAAEIFRAAPDRLSLLMHGNNHVAGELGRDFGPERRAALVTQALARVESFERRTGLTVSRVMAAPHGIFSEGMLETMARTGIDAACVSFGSLNKANRGRSWTLSMGLGPSTPVGGLPVLNRIRLSVDHVNEILIAAYLGQPIVPNGHHGDLKDRLELVRSQAKIISGLGGVSWASMRDIARAQYLMRVSGEELLIKPLSRRIRIVVPDGIGHLRIESSALTPDADLVDAVLEIDGSGTPGVPIEGAIPVRPGDTILLSIPPIGPIEPSRTRQPRTPLRAVLRRVATESADRLRPYWERLAGRS